MGHSFSFFASCWTCHYFPRHVAHWWPPLLLLYDVSKPADSQHNSRLTRGQNRFFCFGFIGPCFVHARCGRSPARGPGGKRQAGRRFHKRRPPLCFVIGQPCLFSAFLAVSSSRGKQSKPTEAPKIVLYATAAGRESIAIPSASASQPARCSLCRATIIVKHV